MSIKKEAVTRESKVDVTLKLKTSKICEEETAKSGQVLSGNKKIINQYKIEKELGSGEFATVFLCVDMKTKIPYALKQMNKK